VKLVFHEAARREQREAVLWYRQESRELGARFTSERLAILKRIASAPQHFPYIDQHSQRALLKVFPYKIIFVRFPHFIAILAVAHTSRHPDYWRDRSL